MEFDPSKILRAPVEALKFIGQRLVGGAWSDLPHPEAPVAIPPKRLPHANIEYIQTHMGD